MKIGQVRNLIEGMADLEEMFVAIYDMNEANEYIEENLDSDDETIAPLTKEEWSEIVEEMNHDEGIWDEMSNAFRHFIDKTIEKRKGKDDNSERVNQDALSNE